MWLIGDMEGVMNKNYGSRVMAVYKITYHQNGFIQEKRLISREDMDNILKPIKNAISIIEDDNKGKQSEESKLLRNSLKIMFGSPDTCFAEGGLLYDSIKTGFISLPENQGGNHKVTWEQIF